MRVLSLFAEPRAEGRAVAALLRPPAVPGLTEALGPDGRAGWTAAVANLRSARMLHPATPDPPDAFAAHSAILGAVRERFRTESPAAWRAGHGRLYEY